MAAFKNWLNQKAAQKIAVALSRACEKHGVSFSSERFLSGIERELKPLELKQRMLLLTRRLEQALPQDPALDFKILQAATKQNEDDEIGVSGFLVWPFTQYVATHGLTRPEQALQTLHHLTQVFTGEFAIRPFLREHRELTFEYLHRWTQDESEHVRRLVSEGTRPFLPWGMKLAEFSSNPELTWPLLEKLKMDESLYVRKSVANHINDLSKDNADWLVEKLTQWQALAKSDSKKGQGLSWIIKHGTRTLVKRGHQGALKLHGVKPAPVKIRLKVKTKRVRLGSALEAEVQIENLKNAKVDVILDHEILFLKANGRLSGKVFKGRRLQLDEKQKQRIMIRIPIRIVTTRTYHMGRHGWSVLINGIKSEPKWFELYR